MSKKLLVIVSCLLLSACGGDEQKKSADSTGQNVKVKETVEKNNAQITAPSDYSNAYGGKEVKTNEPLSEIPPPPRWLFRKSTKTFKVKTVTKEELDPLKEEKMAQEKKINDEQADKRFD